VTVSGHVIVFGHVFGHVTWEVLGDHVICYVMGHMMFSWDHVGVSLSLLSGYSLALGLGWMGLGGANRRAKRGGEPQLVRGEQIVGGTKETRRERKSHRPSFDFISHQSLV